MAAERGWALPHVRAWRRYQVLTQDELAEQAGLTIFTVQRAEYGERVSAGTVRKLAKALGITPTQLRDEEPVKMAKVAV